MKIVIEKSWNIKHWQTVKEFCDQSWNFNIYALEFYQICAFFADILKLSVSFSKMSKMQNSSR